MNTRPSRRFPRVSSFLVAAFAAAACGEANAQLNEAKIERDATGIYSGAIKTGKLVSSTPGYPASVYTTKKETGKMKIPVKDGNLSTSLTDKDLETPNNKATFKGKEEKSKIQRGGVRIAAKASGTVTTGPGPKWTKASITGNLDDKGAKWSGDCEAKAKKVFPPYNYNYTYDEDGDPETTDDIVTETVTVPASTLTITGLDVDGKG